MKNMLYSALVRLKLRFKKKKEEPRSSYTMVRYMDRSGNAIRVCVRANEAKSTF